MGLPDAWNDKDDLYLTKYAHSEGRTKPEHPTNCLCNQCVIVFRSCGDPRCDDITHIDIKWRNDAGL